MGEEGGASLGQRYIDSASAYCVCVCVCVCEEGVVGEGGREGRGSCSRYILQCIS